MAYSIEISGVYTIYNKAANKYYVGYSCNVGERINDHRFQLRNGVHYNAYLQMAFNKHGEGQFEFELLEEYPKSLLPAMEHYWSNALNATNRLFGYNIRPTHPENTNLVSEETRQLISRAKKGRDSWMKGKSHRPESIAKMKASLTGRPSHRKGKTVSDESRQRMSAATKGQKRRLGVPHSEEAKRKMSATKQLKKLLRNGNQVED